MVSVVLSFEINPVLKSSRSIHVSSFGLHPNTLRNRTLSTAPDQGNPVPFCLRVSFGFLTMNP